MLVHTLKQVEIDNAVAEAVYLVFGGIPEAAKALRIVPQGVRNTLTEGRVATRLNAERWEAATEAAGCKIPREELIGWAKWRGPERHAGDDRLGKGSAPRLSTQKLAVAPRADAGADVAQPPASTLGGTDTARKAKVRKRSKSSGARTRSVARRTVAGRRSGTPGRCAA